MSHMCLPLSSALGAMNSKSLAIEDIKRAFMQLEFAIKLMCYCELGKIHHKEFDSDVTIILENENVSFPSGSFKNNESLVLAAQTGVSIAFGVTANVLDAAFEVAGIKRSPSSNIEIDVLRSIVYMVRCAFAHNSAMPCWEVRGQYSRQMPIVINGVTFNFNFQTLNGQPFEYEHIGGFANWQHMRSAAEKVIKSNWSET